MKVKPRILIFYVTIVALLILFLINNPRFVFALSPWKTQDIVYRHLKNKNCRIEYQMQDVGAFGYNKRIVKVETFLFIDFTEEIDTTYLDKSHWQRVEEYVNELELKGG
jgi:hypothetical protein